jgi:DNA ligase D-like protein (predicted ligase)
MLARLGDPFDSEEHLYEPKWDGFRALAFVERDVLRLRSRRDHDLLARFPELEVLSRLPAGLVLDGEIVRLEDGRCDFQALLGRRSGGSARAATEPVTFVAFDLLYEDHKPLLDQPLEARRARLEALGLEEVGPRVARSEGVVGGGLAFFEQALGLGFEGMLAKRLASPYEPGRRSGAWVKSKAPTVIPCAIVGWVEDDRGDLKSLVVAADDRGVLRCVGKVGSGLDEATRRTLRTRFATRTREQPVVPCPFEAHWVEPDLVCRVAYLERTRGGTLRHPVFRGLVEA